MKLVVLRERAPDERRVALVPDTVARLVKSGLEVLVEADAGAGASFANSDYVAAGARVVEDRQELLGQADLALHIGRPEFDELERLREGAALVSLLWPQLHLELVEKLLARKTTAFALDAVPRISRAQSMDVLSSMSTLAGYKAVLLGASALGKILPMLVTAAGTVPPSRALILGAGVAGLQAIATARRLGAIVHAFDIRPATKEQVESLGAQFLEAELKGVETETAGGYAKELSREAQDQTLSTILRGLKEADLVITTALIPGKPAPCLITEDMVKQMRPGSVIVDLAAEMGGNCPLTQRGGETVAHGVRILGPLNLPATVPVHASQMFSKNLLTFLQHVIQGGALKLDFEDTITTEMCVTHAGELRHEPTKKALAERSSASPGGA